MEDSTWDAIVLAEIAAGGSFFFCSAAVMAIAVAAARALVCSAATAAGGSYFFCSAAAVAAVRMNAVRRHLTITATAAANYQYN